MAERRRHRPLISHLLRQSDTQAGKRGQTLSEWDTTWWTLRDPFSRINAMPPLTAGSVGELPSELDLGRLFFAHQRRSGQDQVYNLEVDSGPGKRRWRANSYPGAAHGCGFCSLAANRLMRSAVGIAGSKVCSLTTPHSAP